MEFEPIDEELEDVLKKVIVASNDSESVLLEKPKGVKELIRQGLLDEIKFQEFINGS